MIKEILLDDIKFNPTLNDLPILIHGREHEGSSLFTVTFLAGIYSQNPKIIFLSGYPMAREELIKQIDNQKSVLLVDKTSSIDELVNSKVVFIPRENLDYFPELIALLPDLKERIILIKNIDLFDEKVFLPVMNFKHLILSGNLDKCSFNKLISETKFKTKVCFSRTNLLSIDHFPNLNKYEGYLIGEKTNGIVKVRQ